jgi:hypothetical protein
MNSAFQSEKTNQIRFIDNTAVPFYLFSLAKKKKNRMSNGHVRHTQQKAAFTMSSSITKDERHLLRESSIITSMTFAFLCPHSKWFRFKDNDKSSMTSISIDSK